MKSNLLKQTLYEMRHQPVATSVTLIGTAFAIFLIMTVMMINSTGSISIPPESKRDHILYGMYMHTRQTGNDSRESSAYLSAATAEKLYRGLEGIDTISIFIDNPNRVEVKQHGHPLCMLYNKRCDEAFLAIYDHKLLAGKFFDRASVEAHAPVAVLTKSAARKVTGADPEKAIGQTILINHTPATIIGVIADHTPLANHAFGEIFTPLTEDDCKPGLFGWLSVAMLRNPAYSEDFIRQQVKNRYDNLNNQLEAENQKAIYHEQPYNTRILVGNYGSNTTPSTKLADLRNLLLILFLMIVPAINMSAMMQTRLSQRMAETGIKRAYGATRSRIILDILTENMIITAIGGAIGLIFSLAAAWFMSSMLFNGVTISVENLNIPWQVLFNKQVFIFALVACFILNIISAGIPAWRASRIAPVNALRS